MVKQTILCIGPTPAAQRVMVFSKLTIDAVNRASVTIDGIAGKSINVAKVLEVLGERPLATGFIGGVRGQTLLGKLRERGIDCEFVAVSNPTRQCITVIDESTVEHTELVEESRPVSDAAYDQLWRIIKRRMLSSRAAIMSGTITPGGPIDFYERCTRLAHRSGVLALVDAQGPALLQALQSKPSLVKPNRAELAATLKQRLAGLADLKHAMRTLKERGAERVVITAGKAPTLAYDGHQFWRVFSPAIQVRNPIGSGDAFTAGLVWRLLRGDDLGEACRWAAATGAANAMTLMAGEINRADVRRLAKETKVEPV